MYILSNKKGALIETWYLWSTDMMQTTLKQRFYVSGSRRNEMRIKLLNYAGCATGESGLAFAFQDMDVLLRMF